VLAAATEDLIVATDATGLVTVFNTGAERMLGYAASEVVGKVTPLVWHDITELARRAAELGIAPGFDVFVYAAKDGTSECREWRFVRKDGSELVAQLTVTPVKNALGTIIGYLGVAHDLTARIQSEQALRRAEARYRTLVDQLPAMTYISELDASSTTLYVSPQIQSILGFSPTEWLNDPDAWVRRLHPEDRAVVLAEHERRKQTGEAFIADYRMLARDGQVVWLREQAVVVRPDINSLRSSRVS